MAHRTEILNFICEKLKPQNYRDSSLNGLQFEGAEDISRIAVAVDTGVSVIERAADIGATMLLVHHGMFWNSSFQIVGAKKKAISLLTKHDINLVAMHLPLDGNEEYGNNFGLARLLGLSALRPAAYYEGAFIGCIGENTERRSREDLMEPLLKLPGIENPRVLEFGPRVPARICVVSGAGADEIYNHARDGFDTLITGEPRQFAYHYCKEECLNAFFIGHYASETVGVRALGEALASKFGIECNFIHEPTGI